MRSLLAAKAAFDEAVRMRRNAAPLREELSLLLLHDAVELAVIAAGRVVDLAEPKTTKLEAYWPAVEAGKRQSDPRKTLPNYQAIEPLVRARNGLKHSALLPSREQLGDLETYARSFLAETARTFFGTDFERLSETDLIASESIRRALKSAELWLERGEPQWAMCRTSDALAETRDVLAGVIGWPRWIVTFEGPPVAPQTRAHLDSLGRRFAAMQLYIETGLVGTHPSDRGFLEAYLPTRTEDRRYTFRVRECAPEIAAQCVAATVRYVIAVERYAADARFDRWFPGEPTPERLARFAPDESVARVVELPHDAVSN